MNDANRVAIVTCIAFHSICLPYALPVRPWRRLTSALSPAAVAQAPSWQELYLSVTQDHVSRGTAPAGQLSGVTRRVVATSKGGAAGPSIPTASVAEAATNGHLAAEAEGDAAAAPANGLAPLAADRQAVAAPATVGRKRNRKALAPRRCASVAAA